MNPTLTPTSRNSTLAWGSIWALTTAAAVLFAFIFSVQQGPVHPWTMVALSLAPLVLAGVTLDQCLRACSYGDADEMRAVSRATPKAMSAQVGYVLGVLALLALFSGSEDKTSEELGNQVLLSQLFTLLPSAILYPFTIFSVERDGN